jgi:hypothetical protein
MIMFTEIIAPPPPLIALTDDGEMRQIANLATEDRWVKDFIERLTSVLQSMKH